MRERVRKGMRERKRKKGKLEKNIYLRSDVMVHNCNPSTWETGAEES
jgi:hypothetical protein